MNLIAQLTRASFVGVPRQIKPLRLAAARVLQWVVNRPTLPRRVRTRLIEFYHLNMEGRQCRVLLRDGFKMYVSADDVIQRRIMLYGRYQECVWEPKTSQLLRILAKLGRHFLVAGGHVGYFPLLLATNAAEEDSRVFTFEPNDRERMGLARNISENALTKVKVDERALFNRSGARLQFFSDSVNVCSSLVTRGEKGEVKTVTTVSVDDYCASSGIFSLDLIVLDIEGGEPEALQGAERLLAQPDSHSPDLIFELVPDRRDRCVQRDMLSNLVRHGYVLFIIEDAYDYEIMERIESEVVRLHRLSEPSVEEVARLRWVLGLQDPNIFATKRGVARLGGAVEVVQAAHA